KHVRPEDYHIWYCPRCFFTDTQEAFRTAEARGKKFDLLRDKIIELNMNSACALRRIGSEVHYSGDVIPPRSALAAHLLAIHEQELLLPSMRDHEKLGRFYVRAGWQYCWATDAMGNLDSQTLAMLAEFKKAWADLPDSYARCAARAIEELMTSMVSTVDIPDAKREIKMLALISSLHRKLGDSPAALECTKRVFDIARQRRNTLKRTVESGVTSSATGGSRDKMLSDIEWMSNAITEVKEARETMLDEIAAREAPPIESYIAEHGGVPTPEIIDALRQQKFNYHSIRKVVAKYGTELAEDSEFSLDDIAPPTPPDPTQKTPENVDQAESFWRMVVDFAIGKR
ncbi:MAG: DUF2225 domain-containing protein, partial [Planctomycetota bacterium]|nr:DUF2225 domain-containing protein [Planctomycetota bacterium]